MVKPCYFTWFLQVSWVICRRENCTVLFEGWGFEVTSSRNPNPTLTIVDCIGYNRLITYFLYDAQSYERGQ